MKNIIFILFIIVVGISIYSCKDKAEPDPVEVIDSTQFRPKIEFTYELLDSGGVKFFNKSRKIKSFKWYTSWYISKAENPTFYYERNNRYNVFINALTEEDRKIDSVFVVDIKNVPLLSKPDSFNLHGIVLDRKVNMNAMAWNDFGGYGIISLPPGTPSARFQSNGIFITLADFMSVQGKDYKSMKNNFNTGNQPLAQLKDYPTSDYSLKENGWYLLISVQGSSYATGNNASDSLEILEVKEFSTRKLFPGMEDRAFWVTWRIKADAGAKGKIDCILKIKYLIYNYDL